MIDNGLYVDKPVVRSGNSTAFTVTGAAAVLIAGASAKRVRLKIRTDAVAAINISQVTPVSSSPSRIIIAVNWPELVLDERDEGAFVKGNFFAVSTGGSVNVSVIETLEE